MNILLIFIIQELPRPAQRPHHSPLHYPVPLGGLIFPRAQWHATPRSWSSEGIYINSLPYFLTRWSINLNWTGLTRHLEMLYTTGHFEKGRWALAWKSTCKRRIFSAEQRRVWGWGKLANWVKLLVHESHRLCVHLKVIVLPEKIWQMKYCNVIWAL